MRSLRSIRLLDGACRGHRFASSMNAKPLGFVGLGAMGYHMAGHMSKLPGQECLVWNRSAARAERHAGDHHSRAVVDLAELGTAGIVVMCLPTSAEDIAVAELLAPHMTEDACIVSCTSGEPLATKRVAESLLKRYGVHFVDCPVSGGPRGAANGSVTSMLGCDDESVAERVLPVVQSFSAKVVRCGPTGAGHAVKSVNNVLNCAHLLLGAEGLLALQGLGVDPAVALEAINGSSGRSLQTEVRLPEEVLSRRFAYGFKLPLMAKDCTIAMKTISESFPGASLLPAVAKMVQEAAAEQPADVDYTRIVCQLESKAGAELRPSKQKVALSQTHDASPSQKTQKNCMELFPNAVVASSLRHSSPASPV